jgi:hypothetical protein
VSVPRRSFAASPVPVSLAVESAALPDREVGRLALGCLSFGTRQRRADEGPVHRPLVVGFLHRLARDIGVLGRRRRLGSHGGFSGFDCLDSTLGLGGLLGLGRRQDR